MKKEIIRCSFLVCLIGIIISVPYTTLADEEYCYVPDGDEIHGPGDFVLFGSNNKWFYAGKYQRWVWAGTSTWLVVNDFDKEILILDGYASKATMGNNRNNYTKDYHLSRLTRFANVIRGFSDKGYEIVGILVSHNHLDHTMDLGALDVLLRVDAGVKIEDQDAGRDKSLVATEYGPAVFSDDYKVIASKDTVDDPKRAEGYANKHVFTHYLKFMDANGAYLSTQNMSSENMKFSRKADLYSVADHTLVESEYDFEDEASIRLGHFAIQVIAWPHSNLPGSKGDGRVISSNIWHAEAPDARRVFITTSAGKRENDVEGTIFTDHLIYAWPHTALTSSMEQIARIARDHIEFIDRGEEVGFIFANHYDKNGPIDSETEETEGLVERFYQDVADQWGLGNDSIRKYFREQGAIISCIDDFTYCWHSGTNRRLRFGGYKSEVLGMSAMNEGEDWYATKVEEIYDTDCDGYADNVDNCPEHANPDQDDFDGDGMGDACDPDDDNDTVADEADADPLNQYICQDVDLDSCDDCSVAGNPQVGNDGTDTDSDGLCNVGDPDDDNDGLTDEREREIGTDPLNPDTDGDTVGDASDSCPLENATGLDADGNGCIDSVTGLPDVLDALVDDGVVDEQIANALLATVASAQASLTRGNICTAINQIGAFQNEVNAQRGHKISDEAADLLIAYTNNIITHLLEGLPEGESC